LLFEFNPPPSHIGLSGPVAALLAPLSAAARDKKPLEKPMLDIIGGMGFSGVDYGFTTARTFDRDSRGYRWTTLPPSWVTEYDRHSYLEFDPRVADRWLNPTPIIWDRRVAWGRPGVEAFLDHAATFGIGSGTAVFFRDEHYSKTMFTLHAPLRELDESQVATWASMIPAILMLAFEFHAIFRRNFVAAGVPPLQEGSPLSAREIQCLQFAARGLTSSDIGQKLNLAERTVNFHFCNIVTKLAAANRAEAVAIAIASHVIAR
jgi:DNA-binding CsgD family transcriptional regulator